MKDNIIITIIVLLLTIVILSLHNYSKNMNKKDTDTKIPSQNNTNQSYINTAPSDYSPIYNNDLPYNDTPSYSTTSSIETTEYIENIDNSSESINTSILEGNQTIITTKKFNIIDNN